MQYHPDKNGGKDVGERFYQLTEAYEILTGTRKAPVSITFNRTRSSSYHYQRRSSFNFRRQSTSYRDLWEEETERRRKESRKRAKEEAKKRYENFKRNNDAFKKSWYYKPTYYFLKAVHLLGWSFGIMLLFSPLFSAIYFHMHGSQWWKCLFCLPLILAGILCIEHTRRLREEAKPFFS